MLWEESEAARVNGGNEELGWCLELERRGEVDGEAAIEHEQWQYADVRSPDVPACDSMAESFHCALDCLAAPGQPNLFQAYFWAC